LKNENIKLNRILPITILSYQSTIIIFSVLFSLSRQTKSLKFRSVFSQALPRLEKKKKKKKKKKNRDYLVFQLQNLINILLKKYLVI